MTSSHRTVSIQNLDKRVDRQVLLAACMPFGEVMSVDTKSQSSATVEFYDADDAADCVDNLEGSELYGRVLRVTLAKHRLADLKESQSVSADELLKRKRDIYASGNVN